MTQLTSCPIPGRRPAVLGAAAATILLWGSAFVAIRPTARSLGFESLVSARLLLASAVFAIAARPLRVRRLALRELPLVAAIGFSGLVAYQLLLSAGESQTPAGVSAMIFASAPVLVVLLARVALRERLDRRRWLGVAIALAGAALVAMTQGVERGGSLGGALLVLAAVCCYAPWMILTKLAARRIRRTPLRRGRPGSQR